MKTRHTWASYSLLENKYFQVWADYTKKFFDAYETKGVKFWGVTTGNEPMYGFNRPTGSQFGSMGWIPLFQVQI